MTFDPEEFPAVLKMKPTERTTAQNQRVLDAIEAGIEDARIMVVALDRYLFDTEKAMNALQPCEEFERLLALSERTKSLLNYRRQALQDRLNDAEEIRQAMIASQPATTGSPVE